MANILGARYQPCPEGVGAWGETPETTTDSESGKVRVKEVVKYLNPEDREEYLELHPTGRFSWRQRICTERRSGGPHRPCSEEARYRQRHLEVWWGDYEIEGDRLTCVVSFKHSNRNDGHTWSSRIQGDRVIDSLGRTWKRVE